MHKSFNKWHSCESSKLAYKEKMYIIRAKFYTPDWKETLSVKTIDQTDLWVEVYYHLHIQNTRLFLFSVLLVTDVSMLYVATETVQANLKVANKGQSECFTVRNLQSFHPYTSSNCKGLKLALIGHLATFRQASIVSIAMCSSHQSQAGTV